MKKLSSLTGYELSALHAELTHLTAKNRLRTEGRATEDSQKALSIAREYGFELAEDVIEAINRFRSRMKRVFGLYL